MNLRIAAAACMLALISTSHVWSQSSNDVRPDFQSVPDASSDEAMLQALSERKFGVVIIDAAMGAHQCARTQIVVARKVDDQWQNVGIQGTSSFFGTRTRYAGMGLLAPGNYVVARVICGGYTNYVLNGPFAQFHVNGGEVVHLGVLVLRLGLARDASFGRWTIAATSVAGMDPGARSRLKERTPRLYARMVERHMTLVTPTAASRAPAPNSAASSPAIGELR